MKKNLICLLLQALAFGSFAQTFSISPNPSSQAFCPAQRFTYSATISSGSLPSSNYSWTVVNGKFFLNNTTSISGQDLTSLEVLWDDTPQTGTLSWTTVGLAGGDVAASVDYTIATLSGLNFARVVSIR